MRRRARDLSRAAGGDEQPRESRDGAEAHGYRPGAPTRISRPDAVMYATCEAPP